jgi:hypothetical protein
MKTLKIFFVLLPVFLLSCEKEQDASRLLKAKWYKTDNYNSYMDFTDSKHVVINGMNYNYKIEGDSISLEFAGIIYADIYIPVATKHKFDVCDCRNYMKIEDLNNVYGCNFDTGYTEFCKDVTPNKFVGYWIDSIAQDTITFLTNDSFGKRISRFSYSYTADSITVQYSGPEKILVKPKTFSYAFAGDTLKINISENYYGGLTQGEKKYLRDDNLIHYLYY